MVRYRFGPWDHRYYNLVALLRARGLVAIRGAVETYTLTATGRALAESLANMDAFMPVSDRCRVAAQAFQGMTGTALKEFIYEVFDAEVSALPQGALIQPPGQGA